MIFYVHVGVALVRPPTVDEYRRYVIAAPNKTEAALMAAQMAACTSVMPVDCTVVGTEEHLTFRQEWRLKDFGAYVDESSNRWEDFGAYVDESSNHRHHAGPKGSIRCVCGHPGMGLAWHDKACPAYVYLRKVIYT